MNGLLMVLLLLGGLKTTKTDPGFSVENYLQFLQAVTSAGAQPADVDLLLSLYSDDVIYQHPEFNQVIEGKDQIRQGLLNFLPGYHKQAQATLLEEIRGKNLRVIKYRLSFATLNDKQQVIEQQRIQIQVLETAQQKIKRIIEYWE